MPYANNKGADQPAHPRSLISTFVVRCLDSIISLVSILTDKKNATDFLCQRFEKKRRNLLYSNKNKWIIAKMLFASNIIVVYD